jgi:hypothetical protein
MSCESSSKAQERQTRHIRTASIAKTWDPITASSSTGKRCAGSLVDGLRVRRAKIECK